MWTLWRLLRRRIRQGQVRLRFWNNLGERIYRDRRRMEFNSSSRRIRFWRIVICFLDKFNRDITDGRRCEDKPAKLHRVYRSLLVRRQKNSPRLRLQRKNRSKNPPSPRRSQLRNNNHRHQITLPPQNPNPHNSPSPSSRHRHLLLHLQHNPKRVLGVGSSTHPPMMNP